VQRLTITDADGNDKFTDRHLAWDKRGKIFNWRGASRGPSAIASERSVRSTMIRKLAQHMTLCWPFNVSAGTAPVAWASLNFARRLPAVHVWAHGDRHDVGDPWTSVTEPTVMPPPPKWGTQRRCCPSVSPSVCHIPLAQNRCVSEQLAECDDRLFNRICHNAQHVLQSLLPPPSAASQNYDLRPPSMIDSYLLMLVILWTVTLSRASCTKTPTNKTLQISCFSSTRLLFITRLVFYVACAVCHHSQHGSAELL